MKSIDKIIASKTPIRQTECLWVDLSGETPTLKMHINGEWTPVGSEGGSPTVESMIEISHHDLKELRDTGKLTPGQQYRITDYNCVVNQVNCKSADHQFDIIVTADSESVLNENARAINHEFSGEYLGFFIFMMKDKGWTTVHYLRDIDNDEVIENITYYAFTAELEGITEVIYSIYEEVLGPVDIYSKMPDDSIIMIVTKADIEEGIESGYMEFGPLYETDYFKDCNLSAWELKYTIDNDGSKYMWSDDNPMVISNESVLYRRCSNFDNAVHGKYAWCMCAGDDENYTYDVHDVHDVFDVFSHVIFTDNQIPKVGDTTYAFSGDIHAEVYELINGFEPKENSMNRGTIYWMKDEFNNECSYDFKNVMYQLNDGRSVFFGFADYLYTFNRVSFDKKEKEQVRFEDASIYKPNSNLLNIMTSLAIPSECSNNIIKQSYFLVTFALPMNIIINDSYNVMIPMNNLRIGKNTFSNYISNLSNSDFGDNLSSNYFNANNGGYNWKVSNNIIGQKIVIDGSDLVIPNNGETAEKYFSFIDGELHGLGD